MVSNSSHVSFYTFPGLIFRSLLWRGSISSYDGAPVNRSPISWQTPLAFQSGGHLCRKKLWPTVKVINSIQTLQRLNGSKRLIGFHLSQGFRDHPLAKLSYHLRVHSAIFYPTAIPTASCLTASFKEMTASLKGRHAAWHRRVWKWICAWITTFQVYLAAAEVKLHWRLKKG